jgi:hypothetical protein|tara:strand:- start:906 stop:1256 length:351 start_codon:yes stop_codon:yes gene_type:complete
VVGTGYIDVRTSKSTQSGGHPLQQQQQGNEEEHTAKEKQGTKQAQEKTKENKARKKKEGKNIKNIKSFQWNIYLPNEKKEQEDEQQQRKGPVPTATNKLHCGSVFKFCGQTTTCHR